MLRHLRQKEDAERSEGMNKEVKWNADDLVASITCARFPDRNRYGWAIDEKVQQLLCCEAWYAIATSHCYRDNADGDMKSSPP